MKYFYVFCLIALIEAQSPKISSTLLTTLKTGQKVTLILSMKDGRSVTEIVAELQNKTKLEFTSRDKKITSIVQALETQANKVQGDLVAFLQTEAKSMSGVIPTVSQLWITNQIIVTQADDSLVQKLLTRSEILKIEQDILIPLDDPIDLKILPKSQNKTGTPKAPTERYQWGVEAINAKGVWDKFGYKGQNVVVGSIDTGVRMTHEILKGNYRQTYGWYDAYAYSVGEIPSKTPIDPNGHGTHTVGSICGTNGIGVAPQAQWVACRGCGLNDCPQSALLKCAEWIMCPFATGSSQKNCDAAPHIVSNSWGGRSQFFREAVNAWRLAGIIPIFSLGNDGSQGCWSTGAPGNHEDVLGIGSVTEQNAVSYFSSRGPVTDSGKTIIKPDVSAPGSNIVSAYFDADDSYAEMSGTSMAAPHVSGLVALLLNHESDMDYNRVKDLLRRGAVHTTPQGENCDGTSDSKYPNNAVGYGRVDALKTIQAANSAPAKYLSHWTILILAAVISTKLF